MKEVLSVRAYARQRTPPVSHTAVLNAIRDGRLTRSVKRRPNGRVAGVVVALADREWLANTDPGAQRDVEVRAGAPRGVPAAPRAEAQHPPDSTPGLFPGVELPPEHPAPAPASGTPTAAPNGLTDLRVRLMESQASLAALELAQKSGQLVDVAGLEQEIAAAWGLVSTGFLALAEALPEELAGVKGVAELRLRMREAVRGELERLATMIGGV